MNGTDPKHPERRTASGLALYVGALAGTLLAASYPVVTAVVAVIVGSTVWSVRWAIHTLRETDAPSSDRSQPEPAKRLSALVQKWVKRHR